MQSDANVLKHKNIRKSDTNHQNLGYLNFPHFSNFSIFKYKTKKNTQFLMVSIEFSYNFCTLETCVDTKKRLGHRFLNQSFNYQHRY